MIVEILWAMVNTVHSLNASLRVVWIKSSVWKSKKILSQEIFIENDLQCNLVPQDQQQQWLRQELKSLFCATGP